MFTTMVFVKKMKERKRERERKEAPEEIGRLRFYFHEKAKDKKVRKLDRRLVFPTSEKPSTAGGAHRTFIEIVGH